MSQLTLKAYDKACKVYDKALEALAKAQDDYQEAWADYYKAGEAHYKAKIFHDVLSRREMEEKIEKGEEKDGYHNESTGSPSGGDCPWIVSPVG